ncbi:MAG: hypothetical protein QM683_20630 [Lacrimispora sp.]
MEKYTSGSELPIGFGLALEEYKAMNYFFSLPAQTQQQMIVLAHTLYSTEEMLAYVHSFASSEKVH